MVKINFRDKEISKLEALALIKDLETNKIQSNLNEQEQKSYVLWKNIMLKFNIRKTNTKELSEKEYLIGELNSKIQLVELGEKIKYCEKHGHIPNYENISSGQSGTKVYGICKRCGMGYNRSLNSKEWGEFNNLMNTPMTI